MVWSTRSGSLSATGMDEVSQNKLYSSEEVMVKIVIDPLLTYVASSLRTTAPGIIAHACRSYYSISEVLQARDVLWSVGDTGIMPEYVRRRDAKEKEFDKTIDDIMKAMCSLDAAGKMPEFGVCAKTLSRIPKALPGEMYPLSVCERIGQLEEQLMSLCGLDKKVAALEAELSSAIMKPTHANHYLAAAQKSSGLVGSSPSSQQTSGQRQRNSDDQPRSGQAQRDMGNQPRQKDQAPQQPQSKMAPKAQKQHHASPPIDRDATQDREDGYQTVHNKRRRPKRVVHGTSSSTTLRGAPEPSRDIFVYRVDHDTSCTDITDHLTKYNVEPRKVEKVSNEKARFASFRVELRVRDMKPVLKSEFWPEGVNVRRFFKKSTNVPDDADSDASSEETTPKSIE